MITARPRGMRSNPFVDTPNSAQARARTGARMMRNPRSFRWVSSVSRRRIRARAVCLLHAPHPAVNARGPPGGPWAVLAALSRGADLSEQSGLLEQRSQRRDLADVVPAVGVHEREHPAEV